MKIIKIILIAIAVIIAMFFIVAAFAPKTFKVERKITIKAPADVVFAEINSFQKWESWSPWLKKDSTIKNTYTGPEQGVGNKTSWTSKKSGIGSMEIIESVPGKSMRTKLVLNDFTPFEAHFTLNETNGVTEISWSDSGSAKYPMNIFSLFADKAMGPDFEEGLANLKKHVEELPQWNLGTYKIEELEETPVLSVLDSCPAAEIGKKLGGLYYQIGLVIQKNKLNENVPVRAYYHSYSPEKVVLEAAVPVSKTVKGEGNVKSKTMPKTKALTVSFHGDYMYLAQAVPVVVEHMKTNHLEQAGPEMEVYTTDPTTVKDKRQIETIIYFPVK